MEIVRLRSEISRATAIGDTFTRASTEVDSAEAAVRVAVQLVERARVLAAQGASGTAIDRASLAQEVRGIHEQLVNLTFTSSDGRYVFSGDLDQTPLYKADWTQPAGVTRLASAENTRQIEDVNGSRFSIGRTAHEILDSRDALGNVTENNVFSAVYSLGIALENDNRADVETAAALIGKAHEHLGRQTTCHSEQEQPDRSPEGTRGGAGCGYR
jgi:flagellin-like hook-associated protein FlgL